MVMVAAVVVVVAAVVVVVAVAVVVVGEKPGALTWHWKAGA